MTSVFETLDLHLYEEIDSAALVRQLLDRDLPCEQWPTVTVRSEITTDINTLADGLCVIYDVGPASNIGADRWRFPLSLSVFASDSKDGSTSRSWAGPTGIRSKPAVCEAWNRQGSAATAPTIGIWPATCTCGAWRTWW